MSFFEELKRRNVFRVGIAYVIGAWLLLQLTDVLSELLTLPADIGPIVVTLVLIGLPVVLFAAWVFELTPEGVKLESEVDRSQSVVAQTGKKLNIAIIVMLVTALAYFIYESRFMERGTPPAEMELAQGAEAVTTQPDIPSSAVKAGSSAPRNSIAVLPFANRSNRDDDLFFTDGIHDDLLTQLAKLGGLKVISRTSVLSYRDTDKKIPEIAAELGVGTILEGGVQRAGSRIRINAQLIDVVTDEHLWAETFDREMTIDNIFDIQSEITRQIVTAVRGELSPTEAALLVDRPTQSLEAWEAFLRAKAVINQTPTYTREKYQQAQPLVEKAVAADPGFGEAWALLTEVYLQDVWMGYVDTLGQRELARNALDKAMAMEPGSAAVLRARADYAYRVNLDYPQALALLEQAQALEPGNADTLGAIGITLRRLGRWEEALDAFERTLALDPLNSFAAATLTETLEYMNAWDRLEPELERWLLLYPDSPNLIGLKVRALIRGRGDIEAAGTYLGQLPADVQAAVPEAWSEVAYFGREWDMLIGGLEGAPDGFLSLPGFHITKDRALGTAYFIKGEMESARPYLQAYRDQFMDQEAAHDYGNAFRLLNLSWVQMALGDTPSALELAARATQLLPMERDAMAGPAIFQNQVLVLAMAGERDQALDMIAARLDQPGGFSRWTLYLDPAWDFFRDDERFNELVRPDGVEPEPFRSQRFGDGT
jgi:TolB-like protein/Tfp pilus assembly protein PilF